MSSMSEDREHVAPTTPPPLGIGATLRCMGDTPEREPS